jgi:hypothetical protein
MAIAQQAITIAGATLYTSAGISAVTAMYLMNNHNNTVVIQLHVVTDGNSIANSNKIIKDLSIAAGDTYVIDTERLILDNGDSIRATANVDSVVFSTVSYVGV